ncbi:hypothetical protein EH165_10385 [Nakamurella antarctica]|uniref:LPXTG-motif cell wall anchor domain-containing protein n=1 Tax=Nakamurella antarctica TaxID=1902245 RepID=A0A3G8ZXW5_9ACTN|nr:hypothetical protein [Nakamurella antarctica]AZI58481.1 hypothetical protein EH165_10385 [Nakamurella antarctica]
MNTLSKAAVAAVVACAASLAAPGISFADDPVLTMTVSSESVMMGDSVTISGTGCVSTSGPTEISLNLATGGVSIAPDADGNWSYSVLVGPGGVAGQSPGANSVSGTCGTYLGLYDLPTVSFTAVDAGFGKVLITPSTVTVSQFAEGSAGLTGTATGFRTGDAASKVWVTHVNEPTQDPATGVRSSSAFGWGLANIALDTAGNASFLIPWLGSGTPALGVYTVRVTSSDESKTGTFTVVEDGEAIIVAGENATFPRITPAVSAPRSAVAAPGPRPTPLSSGPQLAATGTDLNVTAALGLSVILVASGVGALMFSRRRAVRVHL